MMMMRREADRRRTDDTAVGRLGEEAVTTEVTIWKTKKRKEEEEGEGNRHGHINQMRSCMSACVCV